MDEQVMKDKLKKIFLSILRITNDDFSFNRKIEEFEGWDSLAHMELVSSIESEFGVKFKIDEIVSIQTPLDFLKILESKLK